MASLQRPSSQVRSSTIELAARRARGIDSGPMALRDLTDRSAVLAAITESDELGEPGVSSQVWLRGVSSIPDRARRKEVRLEGDPCRGTRDQFPAAGSASLLGLQRRSRNDREGSRARLHRCRDGCHTRRSWAQPRTLHGAVSRGARREVRPRPSCSRSPARLCVGYRGTSPPVALGRSRTAIGRARELGGGPVDRGSPSRRNNHYSARRLPGPPFP